jgi:hypothetical protein
MLMLLLHSRLRLDVHAKSVSLAHVDCVSEQRSLAE